MSEKYDRKPVGKAVLVGKKGADPADSWGVKVCPYSVDGRGLDFDAGVRVSWKDLEYLHKTGVSQFVYGNDSKLVEDKIPSSIRPNVRSK